MSGNSSRKPSGSSTYSVTRSPLGSPNHVCLRSCPSTPLTLFQGHSQRSLNPAAATNMYVVGMGNTNGRNGLNSGWQVRLMYFSHYILNSYFFWSSRFGALPHLLQRRKHLCLPRRALVTSCRTRTTQIISEVWERDGLHHDLRVDHGQMRSMRRISLTWFVYVVNSTALSNGSTGITLTAEFTSYKTRTKRDTAPFFGSSNCMSVNRLYTYSY